VPGTAAVARWNGTQWSSVGGGVQNDAFAQVNGMCSYRTNAVDNLVIGGFYASGANEFQVVSRWDGASWTHLSGVVGYNFEQLFVNVVCAVGEGDDQSLVLGGRFAGAGEVESRNIVRWDGAQWHGVGDGVWDVGLGNWGDVERIAVVSTGDGPALLAGGYFTIVDGQPQGRIALWQDCASECQGDLDGDGLVNFADLNLLLVDYNKAGAGLVGDADGDGDVDFADLNLLLGLYNSDC
jgi:trimeric autotransporter adhesin